MSTTTNPGRRPARVPLSRRMPKPAAAPLLVDIRAHHRLGHDVVTFEFEGPQPVQPGLHYAAAVVSDRFGRPMALGGRAVAVVRLAPAARRRTDVLAAPQRLNLALPNLRQVTLIRDMGTAVCYALGLHDRVPLRAGVLAGPPRVVIDVPTLTWPTLRLGATGPDVTAAQYLLRARDHALSPDGVFGPATAGTVAAFEKARGLSPDGAVGARTWGMLTGVSPLRPGSRGDAVRALQVLLRKNGAPVVVDGVFGRRTAVAVRQAQAATALLVDGAVGPATWRTLVCRGHVS